MYEHGYTQDVITGISGGDFYQGFWAGSISSVVSPVTGGLNNVTGLSGTAGNVSTMFFGSVSGGLSAELTGGNFWEGAAIGLTVSALNHGMHKMFQKRNLPSFSKLKKHYRRYEDISDRELFQEFGGQMQDALDYNDQRGRNTYSCALRVSEALVENGDKIPYNKGTTLTGENGKHYIVNTEKLNSYLSDTYELTSTSTEQSSYIGKKGIIFFRIGYSDAQGHITLWDSSKILGGGHDSSFYFQKANAIYFYQTK